VINIEGWNRKRGCGRVGPSIARAVHSPGRLRDGFASLGRCLSDQSLRGGLAQGPQQTLHGRMLLLAELFGMALRQTADNGDRGELWLGREPDLDIDGVDQLDFFLGKQEHSNREGFPAYVADRLSAVKWRNWKVHFIWQENMYDPPVTLPLPKVINLLTDLKEERDGEVWHNSWVLAPVTKIVDEFSESLKKYPPIEPGTPDPYSPPR